MPSHESNDRDASRGTRQPPPGDDHLRRLAIAFWRGDHRVVAWALTLVLVVLTLAQVSIPVMLNHWSQQIFDALEQRDIDNVFRQMGAVLLIIGANVVVMATQLWTKRRLQVAWRADLTNRLLDHWTVHGRDYQLGRHPSGLDNPDGRIAEDVRIATESSIDLAHSLFYCVMLLVSFSQILWVLSGPPEISLGSWSMTLPGHLVWIALLYAGAGAFFAMRLGRPLTSAAHYRQNKEADFRFGLGRSREQAPTQAIGTVDGERRDKTGNLFTATIKAWHRQTIAIMQLVMFSSTWSVLSQAVPIMVAAPRYLAGAITLGALMQTAQAFQQMVNALSWPIDNMQRLAECRASFGRVARLHTILVELSDGDAGQGAPAVPAPMAPVFPRGAAARGTHGVDPAIAVTAIAAAAIPVAVMSSTPRSDPPTADAQAYSQTTDVSS
ncbi:MAG: SbmA/BacA-like family transporter [Burkholderiaceae bacterium]